MLLTIQRFTWKYLVGSFVTAGSGGIPCPLCSEAVASPSHWSPWGFPLRSFTEVQLSCLV